MIIPNLQPKKTANSMRIVLMKNLESQKVSYAIRIVVLANQTGIYLN